MMFDRLESIVLLLPCVLAGLLLAFIYIVVPLRVWKSQSLSADRKLEMIDPHQLPPAVDRYFLQMTPSIAALGFVVVAYTRDSTLMAGFWAYLAHWRNRACGQGALLIVVTGPAGIVPKSSCMQFKTMLADGSVVETSNNNDSAILLRERDYHELKFPGVDDPAELYQLHLWHEEQRLDPRLPRFFHSEQNLVDHINRAVKRGFETEVAKGRMIERNGRYYHTLPNAFRCTWKICPPIRQIAKVWRTWAANRIKQQVLGGTPRKALPVVTTDAMLAGTSD